MAFRNIIVESSAHISVKNRQLVIRTDGEKSLPIEDISAVLLESNQSTITKPRCPNWDSAAALFLSAMKSICPARCSPVLPGTAGSLGCCKASSVPERC